MKSQHVNTIVRASGLVTVVLSTLLGLSARPAVATQAAVPASAPRQQNIRNAVERSIAQIENSMEGYRENRHCFSCHHHAHAIIALTELAHRGFHVDMPKLRIQFRRTLTQTQRELPRYLAGNGIGGGIDTAGHTLMALKTGGYKRDQITDAMIKWILDRAESEGHWKGIEYRPPTQVSDFTRSRLCIDAMRFFGGDDTAIGNQLETTKAWVLTEKAQTTEDKVSRMRVLNSIGGSQEHVKNYSTELIAEQRDDGGWGSQSGQDSDPYATGNVLMALHEAGSIRPTDPGFQKAVGYLLSTQLQDGTWHVKTRARAVQEYFETGFPHGKDQFISFTATCWAATALGLSFPKEPLSESIAESDWSRLTPLDRQSLQARFESTVWPVIHDNGDASCINCHNQEHVSSLRFSGEPGPDFQMLVDNGFLHHDDRESLLSVVQSEKKHVMMPPPKFERLTQEEIKSIRMLVDQLRQLLGRSND